MPVAPLPIRLRLDMAADPARGATPAWCVSLGLLSRYPGAKSRTPSFLLFNSR
jgi:hypothetical protein